VLAALAKLDLVARVAHESGIGASPYVHVELPDRVFDDVEQTEALLRPLTKRFGLHVVLVLAVSTTDSFLYIHWYSGKVVRALGCGIEEESLWTRVVGDAEEWEAEAFADEEVTSSRNNAVRVLGRAADGHIESPRRGDLSLPPDAMKYAECALRAHEVAPAPTN
jgi:hypothetical protein